MTNSLKKNLDTVIFEKLKEELIAGNLSPGQLISIDEIAEKYGVSRTPVIHATKLMAAEGIFIIRRNGRVEVPTFSPRQIIDICKMRLVLEDFAAKCICQERNPEVVEDVRKVAEQCEVETLVNNNMIEARKMDLKLHRQLVRSAGNECLSASYTMIQGQFTTANHVFVNHTNAAHVISCEEHSKLVEGLAAFDYKAVSKLLQSHIMDGCNRILAEMNAKASNN